MPADWREADERARGLIAAGRYAEATELAARELGPEILAYVHVLTRDVDDANEAYAQFLLRLTEKLPSFRAEASLKAWMYAIARNAALDLVRAGKKHHVRLSQAPSIAETPRSTVPPHLLSENLRRLRSLFESLPDDDRELMVLRVDRNLPWRDIAAILEPDRGGAELERAAAGLRKRFERIKALIREHLAGPGGAGA